MVPCIDANIPVYVRNIFNPSFEGTVIQGRSGTLADGDAARKGVISAKGIRSRDVPIPIKGITSIDKVTPDARAATSLEPWGALTRSLSQPWFTHSLTAPDPRPGSTHSLSPTSTHLAVSHNRRTLCRAAPLALPGLPLPLHEWPPLFLSRASLGLTR